MQQSSLERRKNCSSIGSHPIRQGMQPHKVLGYSSWSPVSPQGDTGWGQELRGAHSQARSLPQFPQLSQFTWQDGSLRHGRRDAGRSRVPLLTPTLTLLPSRRSQSQRAPLQATRRCLRLCATCRGGSRCPHPQCSQQHSLGYNATCCPLPARTPHPIQSPHADLESNRCPELPWGEPVAIPAIHPPSATSHLQLPPTSPGLIIWKHNDAIF